jgi:hypothetical protein
MATLLAVTQGIKERLETISGLRCNSVEPANPSPPAAWPFVRTPAANYDQTYDGGMTWYFSIYVIVGAQSDQHAQTNLMPYLAPSGAKSIKAAIEGDPTLGGVAEFAVVRSVESIGSYPIAGNSYIGAVLVCEVACGD